MSAVAKENTVSRTADFFEEVLKRVENAAIKTVAANKELADALDAIIPAAISKAVATKNCNAFNKVNTTLRGASTKIADKFRKDFIAYCHAPNGLNMPKDTIIYAEAINQFFCNTPVLIEWFNAHAPAIFETTKLSSWMEAKKKVEKPIKDGRKEADKAIKNVIKTIENYGLQTNPKYAAIRDTLQSMMED